MTENEIYDCSLIVALTLMLFFAAYFITAKTPDKPIFANYMRSRRIMGAALLVLSANYSVHLFCGLRFTHPDAAIRMNLSTYFLCYWLFSSALTALLYRTYITIRRYAHHMMCWLAFTALTWGAPVVLPGDLWQKTAIGVMALWLLAYGLYLSRRLIVTYHRAVALFDDTHSEHIAAYIRWMSIFTWWALIYGVSCGLLTFLPDRYVFLWILSSVPFYIYLYCSYMNYLLFYEQVEAILEKEQPAIIGSDTADADATSGDTHADADATASAPAYHTVIEKHLSSWLADDGYTTPGLTIEDLALRLGTNRTYLSAYIKSTYGMSFREWIATHRISYAKQLLATQPRLTVAEVSEASGFLSLSYFTKIFTEKEGCPPSKWRKAQA